MTVDSSFTVTTSPSQSSSHSTSPSIPSSLSFSSRPTLSQSSIFTFTATASHSSHPSHGVIGINHTLFVPSLYFTFRLLVPHTPFPLVFNESTLLSVPSILGALRSGTSSALSIPLPRVLVCYTTDTRSGKVHGPFSSSASGNLLGNPLNETSMSQILHGLGLLSSAEVLALGFDGNGELSRRLAQNILPHRGGNPVLVTTRPRLLSLVMSPPLSPLPNASSSDLLFTIISLENNSSLPLRFAAVNSLSSSELSNAMAQSNGTTSLALSLGVPSEGLAWDVPPNSAKMLLTPFRFTTWVDPPPLEIDWLHTMLVFLGAAGAVLVLSGAFFVGQYHRKTVRVVKPRRHFVEKHKRVRPSIKVAWGDSSSPVGILSPGVVVVSFGGESEEKERSPRLKLDSISLPGESLVTHISFRDKKVEEEGEDLDSHFILATRLRISPHIPLSIGQSKAPASIISPVCIMIQGSPLGEQPAFSILSPPEIGMVSDDSSTCPISTEAAVSNTFLQNGASAAITSSSPSVLAPCSPLHCIEVSFPLKSPYTGSGDDFYPTPIELIFPLKSPYTGSGDDFYPTPIEVNPLKSPCTGSEDDFLTEIDEGVVAEFEAVLIKSPHAITSQPTLFIPMSPQNRPSFSRLGSLELKFEEEEPSVSPNRMISSRSCNQLFGVEENENATGGGGPVEEEKDEEEEEGGGDEVGFYYSEARNNKNNNDPSNTFELPPPDHPYQPQAHPPWRVKEDMRAAASSPTTSTEEGRRGGRIGRIPHISSPLSSKSNMRTARGYATRLQAPQASLSASSGPSGDLLLGRSAHLYPPLPSASARGSHDSGFRSSSKKTAPSSLLKAHWNGGGTARTAARAREAMNRNKAPPHSPVRMPPCNSITSGTREMPNSRNVLLLPPSSSSSMSPGRSASRLQQRGNVNVRGDPLLIKTAWKGAGKYPSGSTIASTNNSNTSTLSPNLTSPRDTSEIRRRGGRLKKGWGGGGGADGVELILEAETLSSGLQITRSMHSRGGLRESALAPAPTRAKKLPTPKQKLDEGS